MKRVHLGMLPGKYVTLSQLEGSFPNAGANCVSESGLYKLVMRSGKPESHAFQDWVTREVLPIQTPPPRCAVGLQDAPKLPLGRSGAQEPGGPSAAPTAHRRRGHGGGGTLSATRGGRRGAGGSRRKPHSGWDLRNFDQITRSILCVSGVLACQLVSAMEKSKSFTSMLMVSPL